jgi:S-adenosylmethionine decarboxylase
LFKGKHLLIDCRNVSRESCLDDKAMLSAMAKASEKAGASVISQVRYHFGHNSPPGFTGIVLLDESHCSAHIPLNHWHNERRIS